MSITAKDCMEHTGRRYPLGYGFYIEAMPKAGDVAHLIKIAAAQCVAWHYTDMSDHMPDDDIARFVMAYEMASSIEDWLVEGCQLVGQWALRPDLDPSLTQVLHRAMRCAGHIGYQK